MRALSTVDVQRDRTGQGRHRLLVNRATISGAAAGEEVTGGLFQVGQGGGAGIDQVLGGQQSAMRQACVDAGQNPTVVGGGRGGGHVRDHVGSVGSAGLGQMSGESLPAETEPAAATSVSARPGASPYVTVLASPASPRSPPRSGSRPTPGQAASGQTAADGIHRAEQGQ
ncbi:hypothetical protein GCM10010266_70130 [Streptomyces griseomycini]|nr:hypothetical protein GCM10010266_70130 [Streptomyces griseomycini]